MIGTGGKYETAFGYFECPAVSISGDRIDLVVGTFTRDQAVRLVLANDSYEHPVTFRISSTGDRRVRNVIASWNAELPTDLKSPAATWSLGPAGCVLIELVRQAPQHKRAPTASGT